MQLKISVVIPCYNNEAHLERCIDSVLGQISVEPEVIIVDDGSQDDSERVLNHFESSCTVVRQRNGGACRARNAGLEMAQGEFVKFLDADDYLAPGALERQVSQLRSFERNDVSVYGDVDWIDASGDVVSQSKRLGCDDLRSGEGSLALPLTSAPLHYTDQVRRAGGFDPRLPRAQEFDLHMRMWFAGTDFMYRPGLVYYYQQHDGPRVSSQDKNEATYQARLEAYRRYLLAANEIADPCVKEKVRLELARALWSLGRLALRSGVRKPVVDEIFAESRNISGRGAMTGSGAYRLLSLAVGPRKSEALISLLKRI
ncbi:MULTISPECIES: glycosyltransferase family 2 protein [Rhodopirellula]|uniref:glycosyltransferase family 2 protein n=1 Tax=Rhodopirellula TaxID=265488 RepID=UPI00257D0052|nr:glycosyltransferase [Rhodopirellula sp. UBA1907]